MCNIFIPKCIARLGVQIPESSNLGLDQSIQLEPGIDPSTGPDVLRNRLCTKPLANQSNRDKTEQIGENRKSNRFAQKSNLGVRVGSSLWVLGLGLLLFIIYRTRVATM